MSATIQQAIAYMRRILNAPPGMIPGIDKDTDALSNAIKALQENGHGKTWNAYRHKPKEKGGT